MGKRRRVRETEQRFNFGDVNPRLYDPAKGWFEPDPEVRDALESAVLAEHGRGVRPALMDDEA